jgi:hypothetical protein
MNKWVKLAACVAIGAAAFVLSGCGKDYSGTYMAEIGEKDEVAQVLEVEKGNKDGYIIKPRSIGYYVQTSWGEGTKGTIPTPWYHGPYIRHYVIDVNAKFYNKTMPTVTATEPNKNNTMAYSFVMNGIFPVSGSIKIDDKGNLIDETGSLSDGLHVAGRKYVKIKKLNLDEVKKTLQEHVTANAHAEHDYEKNQNETSKVGKIVFEDENQKK